MVLHFFKRIDLIRNTFSNESKPLHNTFPSESNVYSTKSDVNMPHRASDSLETAVINHDYLLNIPFSEHLLPYRLKRISFLFICHNARR